MGSPKPVGKRRGSNQLIVVAAMHRNGRQGGSCVHGILHSNVPMTG
jgi:hypothetical protein